MRMLRVWMLSLGAWVAGCAATRPPEDPGRAMTAEIAEIMATSHQYETAVPLLQQGIAEDPNNPRLHRLLGIVLRDRGVMPQALAELQLAERLAPRDPATAAALGVFYDLQGSAAGAEIWHRRALDLDPDDAGNYNNLGFSLYLRGRDYAALTCFQESLRRNPNQARVYNNLGFTWARLGDFDGALRAFQQAGSKATAQANLGLAHELAGHPEVARGCYQEALRLDRRLDVARKNLANLTASTAFEVHP